MERCGPVTQATMTENFLAPKKLLCTAPYIANMSMLVADMEHFIAQNILWKFFKYNICTLQRSFSNNSLETKEHLYAIFIFLHYLVARNSQSNREYTSITKTSPAKAIYSTQLRGQKACSLSLEMTWLQKLKQITAEFSHLK